MFTGKVDLEDSPFILTDEMGLDYKNKVMYAWSVDGNIPEAHIAMNYSEIVDGQFPVIGVFDFGGGPGPNGGGNQYDGSYKTLFYQGDRTYVAVSSGWNRIVSIFDLTDSPVDPVKVSDFEMVPGCPEQTSGGGLEMHPSGEYMLIDDIRDAVCGPPPGAPADAGTHTIRIVDIKDPANPKVVKDVYIPEVEAGALIRNGATYAWGPNGIVGFPMTSSGFVLYDFSGAPARAGSARDVARAPPPSLTRCRRAPLAPQTRRTPCPRPRCTTPPRTPTTSPGASSTRGTATTGTGTCSRGTASTACTASSTRSSPCRATCRTPAGRTSEPPSWGEQGRADDAPRERESRDGSDSMEAATRRARAARAR